MNHNLVDSQPKLVCHVKPAAFWPSCLVAFYVADFISVSHRTLKGRNNGLGAAGFRRSNDCIYKARVQSLVIKRTEGTQTKVHGK